MEQFVQNMRSLVTPLGLFWPIVLVPIWQEFVFRYIPYRFFYLPSQDFWLVGIISSALFALIHWYAKEWFIVISFFGGLVFWWAMVRYGIIVPTLLHALANIFIWSFNLKGALVK